MCMCNGKTCPKCDPGIETFYQQKVKKAKAAAATHFETTGISLHFEDLLDAKDIWYEYCEIRDREEIESLIDNNDVRVENSEDW